MEVQNGDHRGASPPLDLTTVGRRRGPTATPNRRADVADASLIADIAAGRTWAFDEAFSRYSDRVFALALHITWDRELAEDTVQEVFTRLWCNPARYDPSRGALAGFLLTDCRGRAIDALRAETSRTTREARQFAQAQVHADPPPAVDDFAAREELLAALAHLPPARRRAISLAYWGELTYREVADLLGEAPGTVKSRIRKGLSELRDLVEPADADDVRCG